MLSGISHDLRTPNRMKLQIHLLKNKNWQELAEDINEMEKCLMNIFSFKTFFKKKMMFNLTNY